MNIKAVEFGCSRCLTEESEFKRKPLSLCLRSFRPFVSLVLRRFVCHTPFLCFTVAPSPAPQGLGPAAECSFTLADEPTPPFQCPLPTVMTRPPGPTGPGPLWLFGCRTCRPSTIARPAALRSARSAGAVTGWFGATGPEPAWHKPAERRDASGPPTSRSHGLHQFIRCAKLTLPSGRRDAKSSRGPYVGHQAACVVVQS